MPSKNKRRNKTKRSQSIQNESPAKQQDQKEVDEVKQQNTESPKKQQVRVEIKHEESQQKMIEPNLNIQVDQQIKVIKEEKEVQDDKKQLDLELLVREQQLGKVEEINVELKKNLNSENSLIETELKHGIVQQQQLDSQQLQEKIIDIQSQQTQEIKPLEEIKQLNVPEPQHVVTQEKFQTKEQKNQDNLDKENWQAQQKIAQVQQSSQHAKIEQKSKQLQRATQMALENDAIAAQYQAQIIIEQTQMTPRQPRQINQAEKRNKGEQKQTLTAEQTKPNIEKHQFNQDQEIQVVQIKIQHTQHSTQTPGKQQNQNEGKPTQTNQKLIEKENHVQRYLDETIENQQSSAIVLSQQRNLIEKQENASLLDSQEKVQQSQRNQEKRSNFTQENREQEKKASLTQQKVKEDRYQSGKVQQLSQICQKYIEEKNPQQEVQDERFQQEQAQIQSNQLGGQLPIHLENKMIPQQQENITFSQQTRKVQQEEEPFSQKISEITPSNEIILQTQQYSAQQRTDEEKPLQNTEAEIQADQSDEKNKSDELNEIQAIQQPKPNQHQAPIDPPLQPIEGIQPIESNKPQQQENTPEQQTINIEEKRQETEFFEPIPSQSHSIEEEPRQDKIQTIPAADPQSYDSKVSEEPQKISEPQADLRPVIGVVQIDQSKISINYESVIHNQPQQMHSDCPKNQKEQSLYEHIPQIKQAQQNHQSSTLQYSMTTQIVPKEIEPYQLNQSQEYHLTDVPEIEKNESLIDMLRQSKIVPQAKQQIKQQPRSEQTGEQISQSHPIQILKNEESEQGQPETMNSPIEEDFENKQSIDRNQNEIQKDVQQYQCAPQFSPISIKIDQTNINQRENGLQLQIEAKCQQIYLPTPQKNSQPNDELPSKEQTFTPRQLQSPSYQLPSDPLLPIYQTPQIENSGYNSQMKSQLKVQVEHHDDQSRVKIITSQIQSIGNTGTDIVEFNNSSEIQQKSEQPEQVEIVEPQQQTIESREEQTKLQQSKVQISQNDSINREKSLLQTKQDKIKMFFQQNSKVVQELQIDLDINQLNRSDQLEVEKAYQLEIQAQIIEERVSSPLAKKNLTFSQSCDTNSQLQVNLFQQNLSSTQPLQLCKISASPLLCKSSEQNLKLNIEPCSVDHISSENQHLEPQIINFDHYQQEENNQHLHQTPILVNKKLTESIDLANSNINRENQQSQRQRSSPVLYRVMATTMHQHHNDHIVTSTPLDSSDNFVHGFKIWPINQQQVDDDLHDPQNSPNSSDRQDDSNTGRITQANQANQALSNEQQVQLFTEHQTHQSNYTEPQNIPNQPSNHLLTDGQTNEHVHQQNHSTHSLMNLSQAQFQHMKHQLQQMALHPIHHLHHQQPKHLGQNPHVQFEESQIIQQFIPYESKQKEQKSDGVLNNLEEVASQHMITEELIPHYITTDQRGQNQNIELNTIQCSDGQLGLSEEFKKKQLIHIESPYTQTQPQQSKVPSQPQQQFTPQKPPTSFNRGTIIDALTQLQDSQRPYVPQQNHLKQDQKSIIENLSKQCHSMCQPTQFLVQDESHEYNQKHILQSDNYFEPKKDEQKFTRQNISSYPIYEPSVYAMNGITRPSDRYRQFIEDDSAQKQVQQSRSTSSFALPVVLSSNSNENIQKTENIQTTPPGVQMKEIPNQLSLDKSEKNLQNQKNNDSFNEVNIKQTQSKLVSVSQRPNLYKPVHSSSNQVRQVKAMTLQQYNKKYKISTLIIPSSSNKVTYQTANTNENKSNSPINHLPTQVIQTKPKNISIENNFTPSQSQDTEVQVKTIQKQKIEPNEPQSNAKITETVNLNPVSQKDNIRQNNIQDISNSHAQYSSIVNTNLNDLSSISSAHNSTNHANEANSFYQVLNSSQQCPSYQQQSVLQQHSVQYRRVSTQNDEVRKQSMITPSFTYLPTAINNPLPLQSNVINNQQINYNQVEIARGEVPQIVSPSFKIPSNYHQQVFYQYSKLNQQAEKPPVIHQNQPVNLNPAKYLPQPSYSFPISFNETSNIQSHYTTQDMQKKVQIQTPNIKHFHSRYSKQLPSSYTGQKVNFGTNFKPIEFNNGPSYYSYQSQFDKNVYTPQIKKISFENPKQLQMNILGLKLNMPLSSNTTQLHKDQQPKFERSSPNKKDEGRTNQSKGKKQKICLTLRKDYLGISKNKQRPQNLENSPHQKNKQAEKRSISKKLNGNRSASKHQSSPANQINNPQATLISNKLKQVKLTRPKDNLKHIDNYQKLQIQKQYIEKKFSPIKNYYPQHEMDKTKGVNIERTLQREKGLISQNPRIQKLFSFIDPVEQQMAKDPKTIKLFSFISPPQVNGHDNAKNIQPKESNQIPTQQIKVNKPAQTPKSPIIIKKKPQFIKTQLTPKQTQNMQVKMKGQPNSAQFQEKHIWTQFKDMITQKLNPVKKVQVNDIEEGLSDIQDQIIDIGFKQ